MPNNASQAPAIQHLLVVGGGSAGHVIPAIAVIRAMCQQGTRVSFVGTRSGLEEDLVASEDLKFYGIAAGKLRRYWSWQNVTDTVRIALGVLQSVWLMMTLRPDAVFSKGGFVSFPIALAAWLCRVPVVAHESDLSPGLANRLILPFARVLCTSFAQTQVRGKAEVVHTGTPLRQEMLEGDSVRGRQRLGLAANQPLLVVTGGSLGADSLNALVRDALPELLARFHVVHVCGQGKLIENTADGYQQFEYVGEGWGDILAAANVVISRAGANALFELLAMGKLNLLFPLSAQASRGDQLENAAFAEQAGYSKVLDDANTSKEALVTALDELLAEQDSYLDALCGFVVPDAVASIVRQINRVAGR